METMESCIADAKARHKLLEKESVSDFVEEIFESNLDLHSSEVIAKSVQWITVTQKYIG